MSLHNDIMNLQLKESFGPIHESGHKEARHAAAELALGIEDKLDEAYQQNQKLATELADLERLYMDLLLSVARKWDGETRHQTAKRYIEQREESEALAVAASAQKEIDSANAGCPKL